MESDLALQELEYPDGHTSQSIYVAMPVESLSENVPSDAKEHLQGAAFAIWTTTPWTIPANMAVAVNADLTYAVVKSEVFLHACPLADSSQTSRLILLQGSDYLSLMLHRRLICTAPLMEAYLAAGIQEICADDWIAIMSASEGWTMGVINCTRHRVE